MLEAFWWILGKANKRKRETQINRTESLDSAIQLCLRLPGFQNLYTCYWFTLILTNKHSANVQVSKILFWWTNIKILKIFIHQVMLHRDLLHFLKAAPLVANNVTRYPPPRLHELGVATNGSVWGRTNIGSILLNLGGFTMHDDAPFSRCKWFTKQDFLCATLKSNCISIVV